MNKRKLIIICGAVVLGCVVILSVLFFTGRDDKPLEELTGGIEIMSEITSPVSPFRIEGPFPAGEKFTASEFLALVGKPPDVPVEEMSAEVFFENAVKKFDWQSKEEKESALRLITLREYFDVNLSDVQKFKVGAAEKTVYVFGRDEEGNLVGFYYFTVET